MNSNHNPMTAQIPSGFGMPTCGHAFDAITGRIAVPVAMPVVMSGATTGAVVRDRQADLAGSTRSTLGYAEKSFPWTSAWRPPIS